ncbi:hypothetical protein Bca101_017029 [Brassica carinata]
MVSCRVSCWNIHGLASELRLILESAVKPDEPSWESPWGRGRPGWHIECSAMSAHYLSPRFDIHGGGADLIFPHHENELAQTCAACEHGGVNYWLHNGRLTINGEKMAKSKDNFKTIREITESYHPLALRHFLMSAHYRSPLSFSASKLDSSSEALYNVYQTLQDLDDALLPYREAMSEDGGKAEQTSEAKDIITNLKREFEAKMSDDLNTPHILTGDYQVALKFINDSIGKLEKMQKKQRMSLLVSLVEIEREARTVLEVLGLLTTLSYAEVLKEMKQKTLARAGLSEEDLSQLIQGRMMARKNKEFEKNPPMKLPGKTTTGEVFWGYFFVITGSVSFFGFVFAVIASTLFPPSQNPLNQGLKNDRYYYCFLVPLTLPVITVAVYFHWLSMKLFKHA